MNKNGTWKVITAMVGSITILLTVMALSFRLHAATPHAGAVEREEFEGRVLQMCDDIREIRQMTLKLMEFHMDKTEE